MTSRCPRACEAECCKIFETPRAQVQPALPQVGGPSAHGINLRNVLTAGRRRFFSKVLRELHSDRSQSLRAPGPTPWDPARMRAPCSEIVNGKTDPEQ